MSNNNHCNTPCAHCKRRLTSTSVTQDGTNVNVAAMLDGPLEQEARYCLVLAQPVPVAGYNLPVRIIVSFTDGGSATLPLKRLRSPCGGVCNLEFGEDLPRCKNRVPLYCTNGGDFVDLRRGAKH